MLRVYPSMSISFDIQMCILSLFFMIQLNMRKKVLGFSMNLVPYILVIVLCEQQIIV